MYAYTNTDTNIIMQTSWTFTHFIAFFSAISNNNNINLINNLLLTTEL